MRVTVIGHHDIESVRAVILVIAVGVGAVVLLHGMR